MPNGILTVILIFVSVKGEGLLIFIVNTFEAPQTVISDGIVELIIIILPCEKAIVLIKNNKIIVPSFFNHLLVVNGFVFLFNYTVN